MPTSVTVNGSSAAIYGDKTFAKAGVSLIDGNNSFTVAAQDALGRTNNKTTVINLPATVTFTYDANGNLTSEGEKSYTYNDENRIETVTYTNKWKEQYIYDGLGRKQIEKISLWRNNSWIITETHAFIFGGSTEPIELRNQYNVSTAKFLRDGSGGILLEDSLLLGQNFFVRDANGNVSCSVDNLGKLSGRYLYSPFGAKLVSTGRKTSFYAPSFKGVPHNENLQTDTYAFRDYSPSLQRWLTEDPANADLNLYLSFENDPINKIDHLGLYSFAPIRYSQEYNPFAGGISVYVIHGVNVVYRTEAIGKGPDDTTTRCWLEYKDDGQFGATITLPIKGTYTRNTSSYPFFIPKGMNVPSEIQTMVVNDRAVADTLDHELKHLSLIKDFYNATFGAYEVALKAIPVHEDTSSTQCQYWLYDRIENIRSTYLGFFSSIRKAAYATFDSNSYDLDTTEVSLYQSDQLVEGRVSYNGFTNMSRKNIIANVGLAKSIWWNKNGTWYVANHYDLIRQPRHYPEPRFYR